jgi:hypothetical protein
MRASDTAVWRLRSYLNVTHGGGVECLYCGAILRVLAQAATSRGFWGQSPTRKGRPALPGWPRLGTPLSQPLQLRFQHRHVICFSAANSPQKSFPTRSAAPGPASGNGRACVFSISSAAWYSSTTPDFSVDRMSRNSQFDGRFSSHRPFLRRFGSSSKIENCSLRSLASTRSRTTRTASPIENSRRVRWPTILRTFS